MSIKSKVFNLSIVTLCLFGYIRPFVEISPANLFVPSSLRGIRLFFNEKNFVVAKDGSFFTVKSECLDKELTDMSYEKLDFLLGLKAKIKLNGQELLFTRISPEETARFIIKNQNLIKIDQDFSAKINFQLPGSSYIYVFQFSDGEYGLHLKKRLPGGGVWGAVGGAWVGKFVASAACHTAIFAVGGVVSLVATPAAGAIVVASLESTLAVPIEATTTAVAMAAGIAGGVVTGPV